MLAWRTVQLGAGLVEILISFAIIAIVFVMAVPSFSSWIQGSQIRTAAEAIQNGLQLARGDAVRRNTRVQFVLGTTSSWTVGCATPVADLDGDGLADCPATIQSRPAAEGSSNAVVTAPQTTVTFTGLGRVTPVPAGSIAFDISNPSGGACAAAAGPMRCLRVEVSSAGQIRMCDPALAGTDPRGC